MAVAVAQVGERRPTPPRLVADGPAAASGKRCTRHPDLDWLQDWDHSLVPCVVRCLTLFIQFPIARYSALASNSAIRDAVDSLMLARPPRPAPQVQVAETQGEDLQSIQKQDLQMQKLLVPKQAEPALDRLLNLIVRDFVMFWYTSSISLGDESFGLHARSSINVVVNNLHKRVAALNAKEVSIYLTHSFATTLVRELKDPSPPFTKEEDDRLVAKARSVSRELLYLLAPPELQSEPALTLFVEILTLQIWKVVESLSDDWINQSIISFLEQKEPQSRMQPARPKEEVIDAENTPNFKVIFQICLEGPSDASADLLLQVENYLSSKDASWPPALEEPSVELLTAVLAGQNDELANTFQEHTDKLPPLDKLRSQSFLRLYGQLESYKTVVKMSSPDQKTWQSDSLSILSRLFDALAGDMNTVLQSCCFRCLLKIMSGEIHPDALQPLQNWILHTLHRDYFISFLSQQQDPVDPPVTRTPRPLSAPPSRTSLETRARTDSNSSDRSFSLPSFCVSVTDISDASAFENGRIKNKRDLSFLVAIEANGPTPGYILQRSFPEIERMDESLRKAFPAAGTADFPRALLPSTNHRTSEEFQQLLEGYFQHLLSDARYATSAPVQKFFEKERAGSSQPALNLWDLGRGATKATTKATKLFANAGENAASIATKGVSRGFSQVGTGLSQGFSQVGSVFTGLKPPSMVSRKPSPRDSPKSGTLILDDTALLSSEPTSVSQQEDRSLRVPEHLGPTEDEFDLGAVMLQASDGEEQHPESTPLSAAGAADGSADMIDHYESLVPDLPTTSSADVDVDDGSISPHLVAPEALLIKLQDEVVPTLASRPQDTELNSQDFEHILYAGLSVLEEAYLISNQQWTLKRGIFRILEAVIRTTYSNYIKNVFGKIALSADAATVARLIDQLRESLWPGGEWHCTDAAARKVGDVGDTRCQARALFVGQAPDGLKMALGAKATDDAMGRLFDGLQGPSGKQLVFYTLLDALRLLLL